MPNTELPTNQFNNNPSNDHTEPPLQIEPETNYLTESLMLLDIALYDEDLDPQTSFQDKLEDIDIDDSVTLYLAQASQVPLLTPKEERKLAQRIERGQLAASQLSQENVPAHLQENLSAIKEDGRTARDHMITANTRLVVYVAKTYLDRGIPFPDLIQEGNTGLIGAAENFDYTRGFKFSTYATWWIRKTITRAIANQGRTIRIPVNIGSDISKMLRLQQELIQELGRYPTPEELAIELNVEVKKVEFLTQVSHQPLSLDAPTNDPDSTASTLQDTIRDPNIPDPDYVATNISLKTEVEKALNTLTPRERRVLKLRFGLENGQDHTLEEVGQILGVTRESIRQIEIKAVRKIRYQSKSLRDFR